MSVSALAADIMGPLLFGGPGDTVMEKAQLPLSGTKEGRLRTHRCQQPLTRTSSTARTPAPDS